MDLEKNFADLEDERRILNTQLEEIETRYGSLRKEVNEKENQLKLLRAEREKVSDAIHNLDMTIKELDIKSANLIDHIKENYSLTLEKKNLMIFSHLILIKGQKKYRN
jgi:hypothetical protein